MAGTLTISTLSDGTNSTSSTNCIQGSAKAWGNFNGTTSPSTRASYNISSFTRVSQGVYNVTFTNALPNANYSVVINSSGDQDGSSAGSPTNNTILFTTVASSGNRSAPPTTTGFGWATGSWSGAGYTSPTYICVTVIGN